MIYPIASNLTFENITQQCMNKSSDKLITNSIAVFVVPSMQSAIRCTIPDLSYHSFWEITWAAPIKQKFNWLCRWYFWYQCFVFPNRPSFGTTRTRKRYGFARTAFNVHLVYWMFLMWISASNKISPILHRQHCNIRDRRFLTKVEGWSSGKGKFRKSDWSWRKGRIRHKAKR